MSKAFFDVFPYVKLESRLKALMEQVAVQKIVNVTSAGYLRVHIESSYLIPKEDINLIEQSLTSMLAQSGDKRQVKLYEHFTLSSQYDGKAVMELYRDSILNELKGYSHVLYIIFKKAKITYPGENQIHLALEDTVFVHMQQEELARILDKIFVERCGLNVSFSYEYVKPKSSRTEEDDRMIAAKVAEISRNLARNSANKSEEDVPAAKGASGSTSTGQNIVAKSAQGQNGAQTSSNSNGQAKQPEYRRPLKSADNPDVIYGRDFEDGAMKIEEIQGEMGEVVIRGEVCT